MKENFENKDTNYEYTWDLAVLAAVVIVIMFFYYYRFLLRPGFESEKVDTSSVFNSELQSL